MTDPALVQELHEHLDRLPPEEQRRVLAYARALAALPAQGVPGHALLTFGGTISADDLATISQAIEDACERVDRDEW